MILYKTTPGKIVTLIVGISPARKAWDGSPHIGLLDEIEQAWQKLSRKLGKKLEKNKFALGRKKAQRVQSFTDFNRAAEAAIRLERRGSDVGETLAKFRQMDSTTQENYCDDVYSPLWRPPKFDKNDPSYGRPKPGSLTEARGIAAGHHVGKEIIRLCEVIQECGTKLPDGSVVILFGELFRTYVYISNKVVGILIRARRHGLVEFEGEMLYQKQDDKVAIRMVKPLEEIRKMYNRSDDPATCLRSLSLQDD